MNRRRTALLLASVAAVPVLTLVAIYQLPVGWALGPCIKDWTSPSSYSPRVSKLARVDVPVGSAMVRICYGRPSARNRRVFGALVPFGQLWRTGANEPTRLFTANAIDIGGVRLNPGRYAIYTRPGPEEWEVYFSTSTFHWGNDLGPDVREREVGGITVRVDTTPTHVETMTISAEPDSAGGTHVVLEWERTRVAVPLSIVHP